MEINTQSTEQLVTGFKSWVGLIYVKTGITVSAVEASTALIPKLILKIESDYSDRL